MHTELCLAVYVEPNELNALKIESLCIVRSPVRREQEPKLAMK